MNTIIIGYYIPATREITYLLRETRGREAPEGESSKYVTSRARQVVAYLLPNIRIVFVLKRFSAVQSRPVCLPAIFRVFNILRVMLRIIQIDNMNNSDYKYTF